MRPPQRQCEYFLVRYVPDPVKGEFVNVGVALYTVDEAGPRFCNVLLTNSWTRAKCLDPDIDVHAIEGLEQELNNTLWNGGPEAATALREFFGGAIQLTPAQALLTDSPEAELKQLQEIYLRKARGASREPSPRRQIRQVMTEEFERQGVLRLLDRNFPVSRFTDPDDPLKIDYGYVPLPERTPGQKIFRMYQALSLGSDINDAKSLAFSCPRIRDGIQRLEQGELQFTAVVESELPESLDIGYAKRVMRESGIVIRTIADMPEIAQRALEELSW